MSFAIDNYTIFFNIHHYYMLHYRITFLLLMLASLPALIFANKGPLDGDYAYLGVFSEEISVTKAELLGLKNTYGSYITKVVPYSPAADAGLLPFDYIYGIDDHRTSFTTDLSDMLEKYSSNDNALIHVIRKGKPMAFKVIFGSRYNKPCDNHPCPSSDAFLGVSPSGVNEKAWGVRVNITYNSSAQNMGLRNGDLLLSLNDYPLIDWSDVSAAINMLFAGDDITIEYERNGQKHVAQGKIGSDRHTQTYSSTPYKAKAYMGINYEKISTTKAEKLNLPSNYGHYITKVVTNSPADKAGLKTTDYLYAIDDYQANANQSIGQILRKYYADEEATLHIIRQGKEMELSIVFGNKNKVQSGSTPPCKKAFLGVSQISKRYRVDGVGVSIVNNSTAQQMGLQDNDIITAINGYKILDWRDVTAVLNGINVGDKVVVDYYRDNQHKTTSQNIKSKCDTHDNKHAENHSSWNWSWNNDNNSSNDNKDRINYNNIHIKSTNASADDCRRLGLATSNSLTPQDVELTSKNESMVLTFNLPNSGNTLVRIVKDTGREIYNYSLSNFSGQFSDEINISAKGTYYLEITQNNQSYTQKITIN